MKLTLNLSERCNLACAYCYYREKGRASISFETIKAAIDMSVKHDDKTGICFFGGEPLLEKELIAETVNYTRSIYKETGHKFFFSVTTNGTLLDEGFLQFAKKVNLVIAVSHDGLMSEGGRNYNVAAGFDSDKIRLLLKYQPHAIVMAVVNPLSVSRFAESLEWLFAQGFRYLISSPAHGAHIGWDEKNCDALQEQYEKIARLYVKWTKAGEKFFLGAFETKITSHTEGENYVQKSCHIGRDQISVAVDGKLYPCVQFVGNPDFCIGDVFNGIDGKRQQALALHRCNSALCAKCAISSRCIHTCGCMNNLDTGSVDEVSPFQCRHEKMLVSIVDKMAEKLYRGKDRRFIAKHYDPSYPLFSFLGIN